MTTSDQATTDATGPASEDGAPTSEAEAKPAARPMSAKERRTLEGNIEAILLSLDKPVPGSKIAETLDLEDGGHVTQAVDALNEAYDKTGRAFRIERVAGGFRLMTRPEHATAVAAFQKARAGTRLSRPAIETLAIIAYKQPITRAMLESIRGVACGEVLRSLLERRLITIAGRAEEVGRPMLYATSKQFLDAFGLSTIKDLPPESELPRILEDA
ncbi:MAG: SMC-Scp complex subunit ScpB [Phycisphaerales bacterium]|nr:SMC-Scp complex subunit ScpB [Phycisphaerales bacterium]